MNNFESMDSSFTRCIVPGYLQKFFRAYGDSKGIGKLSAKLDDIDELISSTMAEDPQVKTLLSTTADVWMPVTATSDERRNFTSVAGQDSLDGKGKGSENQ
ncbi:UNVERIFIED_CONTAM: hypothetical protein Scaly_1657000 [Sesamum calycinum]|uniref:Uncharacterized protein n=1 Tax=Sesamum calycinum TaxID=2727403 RepID=A0AAW2NRD0_9LAMI